MTGQLIYADQLSDRLLRWRWLIAGFMSLVVGIYEVLDNIPRVLEEALDQIPSVQYRLVNYLSAVFTDPLFLREYLVFGIGGPVLMALMLSVVQRARQQRQHAVQRLELAHELSQQLSEANDLAGLARILVGYPLKAADTVSAVTLSLYEPRRGVYERITHERRAGLLEVVSLSQKAALYGGDNFRSVESFYCEECISAQRSALRAGVCAGRSDFIRYNTRVYCLPLVQAQQPMAVMHLFTTDGAGLTDQEVLTLNGLAQQMALGVDTMQLQHAGLVQSTQIQAERHRISRDLHDSLGVSLALLRLQLDKLNGEDPLREIGAIGRQLELMRDIVVDAYTNVRQMLDLMHKDEVPDLCATLLAELRSVGEGAGLKVQYRSTGALRVIPPEVIHEVHYITREALANVARHSGAANASLCINWLNEEFIIEIEDDGGGFDPSMSSPDGHYGLHTMRERASVINGTLLVTSTLSKGTCVRLSVPSHGE